MMANCCSPVLLEFLWLSVVFFNEQTHTKTFVCLCACKNSDMRILNGGEYDNDWDYDIYSIIFFNYYSKSLVK